jgi:NADPH:quinone reductase-like Zn-dependent oxidoreductase
MQFIGKRTIKLDKVKTELDGFLMDFIRILEKHTKYVVISGYVSILFGRTRGTEDIDVIIEKMGKDRFERLYDELKKKGFYCLIADSPEDSYEQLEEKLAVRFAKEGSVIPNIEMKFPKNPLDSRTLAENLTVIMPFGKLIISEIEQQIAFKRYALKSEKDLEDARHLENVFEKLIDKRKIDNYRKMIT